MHSQNVQSSYSVAKTFKQTDNCLLKYVKTRPCAFYNFGLIPNIGITKRRRQWRNPSGYHNIISWVLKKYTRISQAECLSECASLEEIAE